MSSDDEIPMGAGADDFSDRESPDNVLKAPSELPEGITKEIVKEAPSANWKKPKAGDEVEVHYVGHLQSDGSEFDSSRSRDKTFKFKLGQGQVIKGWDLGVATMKQGEIAKLTIDPKFGYGESGSPPKIPANATLVFEVELLAWVTNDDLFRDGGVIKTEITPGTGWKKPKVGDEVKLSMKVTAIDGALIDEKLGVEYVIGSQSMGHISKSIDKALGEMKKGEQAQLTCRRDYAYGAERPDGAIVDLSLEQIYETKDVSFGKDKSVMKKIVVEGEGYETPKDAHKVTLSVEDANDRSATLPGFAPQVLEFTLGNGEVCDALELVARDMKKGEKAMLITSTPALCLEQKLGLREISSKEVVLNLEMKEFETGKNTYSLSEDEKIDFGLARKDVGSSLFKSGRIHLALDCYKKVMDLFNYVDNFKDDNKSKAKELKKVCSLNRAACFLKVCDFSAAKASCNDVLKEDSTNVKALFRRAQAEFGLSNFSECMADLKKLVDIQPNNTEARALYKSAQAGQREQDKETKGLFNKMCQGLGKGPIPGPTRKTLENDEDKQMHAMAELNTELQEVSNDIKD